jgi:1,4-dihydroxy-2-naphthoate octaprenyltransferase
VLVFKHWVRAVRPWVYPASIVPIFLGGVLALDDGFFNPFLFFLTLVGGVLIHSATNLFNDYFDFLNGLDTPYSYGSSGVLVEGLLSPGQILKGGIVTVLLVVPIALYLFMVRGPVLLLLGALGILAGYFYTARPVALKYRGVGVPAVFFLMGPIMVIGVYFVQTARFSPAVFLASLPVGCLVAAILYSNEYRDIDHDSSFGIVNPSILLGRKRARFVYYLLVTSAYLLVIVMVVCDLLCTWSLLTLLTLPLALKPIRVIEVTSQGKESAQLPIIDVLTARLHLQFGLLFICGIAIGFFFELL